MHMDTAIHCCQDRSHGICLVQAKIGAASRRRWLARSGVDVSALSDQDVERLRAARRAAAERLRAARRAAAGRPPLPRPEARRAAPARRTAARQVRHISCSGAHACF
jgi:hypothetical protein